MISQTADSRQIPQRHETRSTSSSRAWQPLESLLGAHLRLRLSSTCSRADDLLESFSSTHTRRIGDSRPSSIIPQSPDRRAEGPALHEHNHAPHTPGCMLSTRFQLGRDPRPSPACKASTQLPASLSSTRGKKSWTSDPRLATNQQRCFSNPGMPMSPSNTHRGMCFSN